jgi:flagellar basal body-associated protein FliL
LTASGAKRESFTNCEEEMNDKEGKNRWIILFVIVAVLSLIGVSILTVLLHKVFKG